MTTNGDMSHRQPDESEPLEQLFGEVFALVDETVGRITDVDVDEYLQRVLNQSGHSGQLTDQWQPYKAGLADVSGSMEAATPNYAQGTATDIIARAQLEAQNKRLPRAQTGAAAARQEAEQIVAAAEEADRAREQATKIVRDARDQAERIISVARKAAEQIVTAPPQTAMTRHRSASVVRGVLHIHSAPPSLCPHIEWAVTGILGVPVNMPWTGQPAASGTVRAELTWKARQGTAGAITSALAGWNRLRFEVTEEPSQGCDGVRYSSTPDLGTFTAVIGANGDILIPEGTLRAAKELAGHGASSVEQELSRLLGEAWDAELEPFRYAAENASVSFLDADAAG